LAASGGSYGLRGSSLPNLTEHFQVCQRASQTLQQEAFYHAEKALKSFSVGWRFGLGASRLGCSGLAPQIVNPGTATASVNGIFLPLD